MLVSSLIVFCCSAPALRVHVWSLVGVAVMAYRCKCTGGAAAAAGRGAEAAARDSDAEVEGDHVPKAQRSEVSAYIMNIYRSVTVTSIQEASFFFVCAPRLRRSKRRIPPATGSVLVRFGSVRCG